MTSTVALRCPKCAAEMVTHERSGITIDQCRECRGIYLDRGELEKLVDAEGGDWMGLQPWASARATDAARAWPAPARSDSRGGGGYYPDWHDHADDDDLDRDSRWGPDPRVSSGRPSRQRSFTLASSAAMEASEPR